MKLGAWHDQAHGNLSNHDGGDEKDNVDKSVTSNFTYKSPETLSSLTLFSTVFVYLETE